MVSQIEKWFWVNRQVYANMTVLISEKMNLHRIQMDLDALFIYTE